MLQQANALGRVWAGQNWDLWDAIADTVVVLRIAQPGKPTIICHVEAGQIGRHGANSAGIALNANGLGAGFGTGLGVPGTFVRRKVLESWDMHDALDAIFSVRQSLSSNLLAHPCRRFRHRCRDHSRPARLDVPDRGVAGARQPLPVLRPAADRTVLQALLGGLALPDTARRGGPVPGPRRRHHRGSGRDHRADHDERPLQPPQRRLPARRSAPARARPLLHDRVQPGRSDHRHVSADSRPAL